MIRHFRHPLFHVVVLGILVAAAMLIIRGPSVGDDSKRIVLTAADVLHLRAQFVRTWQREPTEEELRKDLESYVRVEVLYREAVARGYDQNDLVVRRAMKQKMEMLA